LRQTVLITSVQVKWPVTVRIEWGWDAWQQTVLITSVQVKWPVTVRIE
jgi:hypothetical protein